MVFSSLDDVGLLWILYGRLLPVQVLISVNIEVAWGMVSCFC